MEHTTGQPLLARLSRVGLARTPFTRVQALQAGVSPYTLQAMVREQVLRVPLHGVYVPTSLGSAVAVRTMCLAAVASPRIVFVDRTAAWLWGVSAYSLADESGSVPIDAFSIGGATRVRRPGVHGGERALCREDCVEVDGVRVTTPARTAMDLACSLPRLRAVAVVDALMHEQSIELSELVALLPRFRGRRGVVQAREVLSLVDARAESQPESITRVMIIDAGLPKPELQVWVFDEDGKPLYRLDHAYEELKIAIEYDGEKHHSSPEDRSRDAVRRAWLRAHGWIVIVVEKQDLTAERRGRWINALRQARRERLEDLRVGRARPLHRADRLTKEQIRSEDRVRPDAVMDAVRRDAS